jgi:hypothetical protein
MSEASLVSGQRVCPTTVFRVQNTDVNRQLSIGQVLELD